MAYVTRRVLGDKSQSSTFPNKPVFQVETEASKKISDQALSAFIIKADVYKYPEEDVVPSGYYASEIQALSSRVKDGRQILDVGYELIDYRGNTYYVKQSYPLDSKPLTDFYNAMVAAGIENGSGVEAVIGVREGVKIGYVSKNSDFGSIVWRKPESACSSSQENTEEDEDDELDDYLADDDN